MPEPGQIVAGKDGIRNALNGFLATKGTMTLETLAVIPCGDLALLHGRWRLSGTGPDGAALNIGGRTAEVVRRQPDGTWLYLIDNPIAAE